MNECEHSQSSYYLPSYVRVNMFSPRHCQSSYYLPSYIRVRVFGVGGGEIVKKERMRIPCKSGRAVRTWPLHVLVQRVCVYTPKQKHSWWRSDLQVVLVRLFPSTQKGKGESNLIMILLDFSDPPLFTP